MSWSSPDALICTASATPAVNGWSGSMPTSHSGYPVSVSATTLLTLECSNLVGSVEDTVTVSVTNDPTPFTLTATPTQVQQGQMIHVSWTAAPADLVNPDRIGLYSLAQGTYVDAIAVDSFSSTAPFVAPGPGTYRFHYLRWDGQSYVVKATSPQQVIVQ